MTTQRTISINGEHVEIFPIHSDLYGTTTAAGSIAQAIERGFLSCADGNDYKLKWDDKSEIMRSGVIVEVTENRYDEMLEVLPPIYVKQVNGKDVQRGFAVSEAQYHSKDGAVYSIYWQDGEKYFHAWATLTANDKPVNFSELHEYKNTNAKIVG